MIIEGLKNLTYLKIEDTSLSKRKFNFALPKLEEIILVKTMKNSLGMVRKEQQYDSFHLNNEEIDHDNNDTQSTTKVE